MATKHMTTQEIILRSRQLNPCDELYWKCRGYPDRPSNWKELLEEKLLNKSEKCYECEDDDYDDEDDYDQYENFSDEFKVYSDDSEVNSDDEDEVEDSYDKVKQLIRPANWKELLKEKHNEEIDGSDNNYKDDEDGESEDEYDDENENKAAQEIVLRSRQLNPCDVLYWKSRGYLERPANWKELLKDNDNEEIDESDNNYNDDEDSESEDEYDDENEDEENDENYDYGSCDCDDAYRHAYISNSKNPNNDLYWQQRGYSSKPNNWKDLLKEN
ncbi:hypothetical protein GWI33_007385 [Rhynchophorus ferrugineus]|uniref:Uncharacterized protein n=1 Tax=Rhynchophorus ferrugineus TaxID=354439 RepID=A0A834MK49_RHYFE|nr:hypothetical protein GWI33_007385 [Rhynchophorus ferrugineus]